MDSVHGLTGYGSNIVIDMGTHQRNSRVDGASVGMHIKTGGRPLVQLDPTTVFDTQMIVSSAEPKAEQEMLASSPEALKRAVMMLHTGKKMTLTATIGLDKDALGKVAAWNGLLGTVLVDCSAFKSATEYRQFVAQSPYKGLLQYAVHCRCGCTMPVERKSTAEVILDPIDAALAASNPTIDQVPFCKKLGLPVLANPDSYSGNDAITAVQTAVSRGLLDTKLGKTYIRQAAASGKPLAWVRQLFRSLSAHMGEVDENQCLASPVVGKAMQPSELMVKITAAKKDAEVSTGQDKPVSLVAEPNHESLQVVSRQDAAANIHLSGVQKAMNINPQQAKLGDIAATPTPEAVGNVVVRKVGVAIRALSKPRSSVEVDGSAAVDASQFQDQPLEIVVDASAPGDLDVIGTEQPTITF